MGRYRYKARDRLGKAVGGVIEAVSGEAVAAKLKEIGYMPVFITEKKARTGFEKFFDNLFKKVKFADVNMFTQQFSTLQRAGLPMLLTLNALKDQASNDILRDAITQIIRDVEGGMDLSSAFAKHPSIFSSIYVNMVKVGETSGTLDDTLDRLATLGEHEEMIRQRIKMATRY